MNDITIASGDMPSPRSRSVEKALQELAQMAVTEACVSGLCDVCLYRSDLCNILPSSGGIHPDIQGVMITYEESR